MEIFDHRRSYRKWLRERESERVTQFDRRKLNGCDSIYHRRSLSIAGHTNYCDSQIEIVEKTKYLGIQLDQYLVWDEHTRFLRAKVSRAIGFLKYAKKILPQETLSQMYS